MSMLVKSGSRIWPMLTVGFLHSISFTYKTSEQDILYMCYTSKMNIISKHPISLTDHMYRGLKFSNMVGFWSSVRSLGTL